MKSIKSEFSKKLIAFGIIVNLIVIIISVIAVFKLCDTSILSYLIPSVAAELATGTGFYYWKAKNENRYKLAVEFVNLWADKYGMESAIQLAEIILKD